MPNFYEFFAGGGMARAGLGPNWKCKFANDFDFKKGEAYKVNWGAEALVIADIRKLEVAHLPGVADLAWASFPCQDLSLAGGGAGLRGDRSGTFWPFWQLIRDLNGAGRAPKTIALENVCGTLTSHGGQDFVAIITALTKEGYRCGAVVIDAAQFVPHSRPRLFVIGVRKDLDIPKQLIAEKASPAWHTRSLVNAYDKLSEEAKKQWIWWNLPAPAARKTVFANLIEENPTSIEWHSDAETGHLLDMMSDVNLDKVEAAQKTSKLMVGAIYKRTRFDENDEKVQRAEVRFDDVAGCLRTPAGGSSRQLILVVRGKRIRSRLISTRECARLMGLPDTYKLPPNYNEAYHLTGDGVVVPVVRFIAASLLEPIVSPQSDARAAA